MTDLVVAGAGMAGLVAAAEARRLGASVVVREKLDRPGGSMRLSSGVLWRHRDFERFRSECGEGQPELQRRLFDRLDDDLRWLESLGAPVMSRETGNPLTSGIRFEPRGLTRALVAVAGGGGSNGEGVRLGEPLLELPEGTPVILATGGFAASRELVRSWVTPEADSLFLRAAPGSSGDGLRLGQQAGGRLGAGLDQVYARAMPAPPARVGEGEMVTLSQLYARHAEVTNELGERFEGRSWSEVDTAQWMALQPRARAWFRVARDAMGERVRERTVGEMVEAAVAAGAPVRRDAEHVAVQTVAGITTTLGGLEVDDEAQVASQVFACGADAGGIATGGYASGLAAGLVFGRIAARAALGHAP